MSIAKIEHQQRLISLESSSLSGTITALTDRLPGFVEDVNTFLRSLLPLEQTNNSQLLGDRKAHAMVKATEYTTLIPLNVFVPPGLSVTYGSLVEVLEQSERIASGVVKNVLSPFNRWLALQLTNPDRLVSVSGTHIPGISFHDIERATKNLAACFKNSPAQTQSTFGEVFKRRGDFEVVAKDLNNVYDDAIKTTPASVREVIESITGNLDKLVQRIQEDPDTYKPSGPVIKSLAYTAYAIAKECEFYSAFQYQLKSTVQAFRDTEELMEKEIPIATGTVEPA